MKPEIHLPWVNSGKISLGKTMFPRAKVRSVTTAIVLYLNLVGVNQALTLPETFAAILRNKILRTTTKTLPFTGKGKKSTEETLTLTQKKQQAGAWVPWEVKPGLCHYSKSRKVVIHITV